MKAFVFSIGEKTTELCCELLKEYGFEVIVYKDQTSLWEKLKRFYLESLETDEEWFMRVDADIIPNRNTIELAKSASGWTCASGFDWYSQNRQAISIHVMHREIIEKCLRYIDEAENQVRPETYLWRKDEINGYTSIEDRFNCGLHGFGQKDQRDRIKNLKHIRNQSYDWDLLDRIEAL